MALLLAAPLAKGSLTIVSASGGITITAGSGSFGNVNGLGVGTAPTGTSLITSGPTNGVAYTTPYGLQIAGAFTNVTVTAYVSSNFSQPTILILYSCPYSGGCTSWSGYSPLSKNSAQPTNIISTAVGNGTYTAYLGLFVSNANGTAVTGTESATITFTATTVILGYSFTFATATLTVGATVQEAVQLLLAAAGGLSIGTGSTTDYATNFGDVNGLGVGTPSSGLSITNPCSGTCPGTGVVYWTPYQLQPSFSSFALTTCNLTTYVSSPFTNSTILVLGTVSSSGGSFAAISKSSTAPTNLATGVNSYASGGTPYTGYLGLWVSNVNGTGAFNGSDDATLTLTLTVP